MSSMVLVRLVWVDSMSISLFRFGSLSDGLLKKLGLILIVKLLKCGRYVVFMFILVWCVGSVRFRIGGIMMVLVVSDVNVVLIWLIVVRLSDISVCNCVWLSNVMGWVMLVF